MSHRSNNSVFQYNVLTGLIILSLQSAYAGVVRDDVDYQQFRDFAENKGKFSVGAKEKPISIVNKNGKTIDTIFGNGIPMPDWSAVNTNNSAGNKGVATLIDPQYIVSVRHNLGYQDVQFGSNDSLNPDNEKFNYQIIARNNYHETAEFDDYHQPRLHKLVTEVVPIPVVERLDSFGETSTGKENFKENFPLLVRMGSGVQGILTKEQSKNNKDINLNYAFGKLSKEEIAAKGFGELVSHGYHFLTGGVLLPITEYNESQKGTLRFGKGYNLYGLDDESGNDKNVSKMAIGIMGGDSGSPIFAYDKNNNQWKLIGLAQGTPFFHDDINEKKEAYDRNYWGDFGVAMLNKPEFNQSKQQKDNNENNIENNQSGKQFDWQANGNTSTILSDGNQFNLPIYDKDATSSDYSYWSEQVRLATTDKERNDALYQMALIANSQERADYNQKFNHGKNLRISGEKGTLNLKSDINQGAGALYFETDFTVKGENANTTWLGAGISVAKDQTVDWQVKNPKNDRLSKIGEGTLLVNGTGNNEGDISVGDGTVILNQKDGFAFNRVGIVSGRPTVKLEGSNQVNPDNIHFGYRGGRLDVNGNDLTFNYIKNVDDGARIVNNHENKTANIEIGHKIPTEKDIKIVPYGGQDKGDILLLVDNYLDTDGKFISFDKAVAIKYAIDKKIKAVENQAFAYNGYFGETDSSKANGKLNVTYKPELNGTTLLLSGGTNLNGNLTVENGNLLLSGRPTPHAYDHINKEEPFKDDEWLNRTFNASNIVVQENSKLTVGRNVDALNANIVAQNNSTVQLGFVNGKTPVCVRSDYSGATDCENKTYNETVLQAIPATKMVGDLALADHAQVLLGKTNWEGKSTSSSSTNQLTLSPEAKWTMKGDSSVGHLAMEKGSQITLNSGFEKDNQTNQFNTLTIQGNLSGEGQFNYLTNIAGKQGDKVVVEGIASGSYILNVKDSGQEPKGDDLVLMNLTNQNQPNTGLNVQLNNANKNGQDYVDLGAWRYDLKRQNNQFVLVGKNTQAQNDTNTTTGNTTTGNTTTGNTTTGNTTTGNATTSNNTTTVSVPIVPDSPVVPTQPTQAIVPSAQSISKYTNLALSGRLATLETNIKTLEPINQRLLDIHAKSRGIWVHHESAKQKNQSEHYRGYQQKHHLFQLGVDKETDLANGQLLLGVALSNTNSEQTFDEGHGDSRLILGGLYGRWLSPNRSWIAFDAGYGVAKHKLVLDNEKVSHNQNVAHLGVKVGKTWQLGTLEIQPSLSARYHSLSKGRYQLDGANIQYGKWNAMAYQPELRLSYLFKTASGFEFNPYLSTSYLYLSGRSHVDVNAYRFSLPMNRTWQNQAGVSIQKGKWHGKMYLNHERGKQTKGRAVGVILNYEW